MSPHPLPPMCREMRKTVHELAHAFKLYSKSENNDAARFTTLIKTTRGGVNVNEKAIARTLVGNSWCRIAELLIPQHPSLTGQTLASRCYLLWDRKKAAGLGLSEG